MRGGWVAWLIWFVMIAGNGHAAARDQLIFHAVAEDGSVLRSQYAERPFNPASVVKVGTSLWALERLGAEHRYTTGFAVLGEIAPTMESPLVVLAGGDPDFHLENAVLAARELNRRGVRVLDGGMTVIGSLWVGWQNGTVHRIDDPVRRAEVMGERLRQALDPARWSSSERAAWDGMCSRRGWGADVAPPAVVIHGEVRVAAERPATSTLLVRHLSSPLSVILRRFNVYSNNDVIRIADGLGGVAALQAFLQDELAVPKGALQLETASGEMSNRMSALQVVRLLQRFAACGRQRGLQPAQLLPLVGCDPGPTRRMFPRLAASPHAGTVTVKTGTLSTTDGGVAVLAGSFRSRERGEVVFCVAAEEAGGRLEYWRNLEQQWLLDLMASAGGAAPQPCAEELPLSDTQAVVVSLSETSD